jgi:hypothetical protein
VDAATAIAQSLAAGAQNDSGSRRADPPIFAGDDTHVSVAVFSTAGPREQRPPTLRGFRARTSAEIAAAKMWQTLVTALLAGLIGYGLFAPKFIGDYQDFLVIFFWAFGLDLTVDAVSKLAPTARR